MISFVKIGHLGEELKIKEKVNKEKEEDDK